jgi:hypothetical protein
VIGGVIPRIEEHGSEHGLEHVCEERLQIAPTAFRDALAEVKVSAHVELLREQGQRVGVDHRRPRLRQLAFAGTRVVLV